MKTRLLIVDDHGEIRRLVRLTFHTDRHEIHEAADATAALALVERVQPQVVLLDVMMPGAFDGLELCRRLKADARVDGPVVVLISARGQRHDVEAGLAAGADSYFIKPFSPIELLDEIEQLVSPTRLR